VLTLSFRKLLRDVYVVAGPELTHFYDAYAYLVTRKSTAILIDAGSGLATEKLFKNIINIEIEPRMVKYLVLTHGHYDHIGGAKKLKEKINCKVVMHQLDAEVLEKADAILSAADFYGESFEPCNVDLELTTEDKETLRLDSIIFEVLHIPGHTPGSIALYYESDQGQKVLFGGDLHGPFSSKWRSDIKQWKKSIEKLLKLDISLLCEGHNIVKKHPRKWIRDLLKNVIHIT